MKFLPGLFFLLSLALPPSFAWAEEESSAGGSGEVSTEQTGSDGKKQQPGKPKSGKQKSGADDEEPDCE